MKGFVDKTMISPSVTKTKFTKMFLNHFYWSMFCGNLLAVSCSFGILPKSPNMASYIRTVSFLG